MFRGGATLHWGQRYLSVRRNSELRGHREIGLAGPRSSFSSSALQSLSRSALAASARVIISVIGSTGDEVNPLFS